MKVGIITGASSGMGKWFSIYVPMFFPEIEEMWIIGRNAKRLEKVANHVKVGTKIIAVDLLEDRGLNIIEELLVKYKPDVRVFVNCAGIGILGDFEKITSMEATEMLGINCAVPTKLTHMILPYMRKNSRLINMASGAAFICQPGFAVYAASKAYMLSLSDALSKELRHKGIYVTAVCPGAVNTPFIQKAEKYKKIRWFKRLIMANERSVVHLALWDSKKKKTRSIYGIYMLFFSLLCKILPLKLILKFM